MSSMVKLVIPPVLLMLAVSAIARTQTSPLPWPAPEVWSQRETDRHHPVLATAKTFCLESSLAPSLSAPTKAFLHLYREAKPPSCDVRIYLRSTLGTRRNVPVPNLGGSLTTGVSGEVDEPGTVYEILVTDSQGNEVFSNANRGGRDNGSNTPKDCWKELIRAAKKAKKYATKQRRK